MCDFFHDETEEEIEVSHPITASDFKKVGFINKGQWIAIEAPSSAQGSSWVKSLYKLYGDNKVASISNISSIDLSMNAFVFEPNADIKCEILNLIDERATSKASYEKLVINGLPKRESMCILGDKINDDDEYSLYNFFKDLFKTYPDATYSFYKSVGELSSNDIPKNVEFMGVYSLHKTECAIQKRLVFDHLLDYDSF